MKFIRLIIKPLLFFLHKIWMKNNREHNARLWSNDQILKYCPHFVGDIINISGGTDSDKEHKFYKSYFKNARSYKISNYIKESNHDIILDLSTPLNNDSSLYKKYDVVFTHTVLEHIYNMDNAIKNICDISRDIIITVIPFIQSFHCRDYFSDYWRFSPHALISKFNEHGFKTLHIDWNDDPFGNIYIFHIASNNPTKWEAINSFNKIAKKDIPGSKRQQVVSQIKSSHQSLTIDSLKKFDKTI